MPQTPAPSGRPSLPYRPALDGLRAIAVLSVLLFHVEPTAFRGGWLGVDLFFVISGFLITSLLARERVGAGRVDLVAFWKARARRLFPALGLVLLFVLAAGLYYVVAGRRQAVALDVLATMAYVANWRLIASQESYFGQAAMPTPVRHAWSLGIEEQFYLLFPLLLLLVFLVTRRRWQRATVMGLLALASAIWMAVLFVPGTDPSRVYYGTDTRAFELLIGATAALALQGRLARIARPLSVLGPIGLVGAIVLMAVVSENATWTYRGGLVLFCLLALLAVLGAFVPGESGFQRLLTVPPLRWLGTISYGVYLWHWPLLVYLGVARPELNDHIRAAIVITASILLAAASKCWVEDPVRRRGIQALVPSRPVVGRLAAAASVPVLLAGSALLLRPVDTSPLEDRLATGDVSLAPAQEYAVQPRTRTVLLLGNSVPLSLANTLDATRTPDLEVSAVANIGCEPYDVVILNQGAPQAERPDCLTWRKGWAGRVAAAKPAAVVFFAPQSLLQDMQSGGRTLSAGSAEHQQLVRELLDRVRRSALDHGAKGFVVVNLACHKLPDYGNADVVTRMNDNARVRGLNGVIAAWAQSTGTPLVDQYAALCPGDFYHSSIDGVPLYEDGLHFTEHSGPIMWEWMAPQVQSFAARMDP